MALDELGRRIPAPTDEWRPQSKKKDTRRWCKGKVGREHLPTIELSRWPYSRLRQSCRPKAEADYRFWWPMDQHGWICYHEVVCSVCKKRLNATPERCPENRPTRG